MSLINKVANFLIKHLPKENLYRSFIFGSLASGKLSPNDCDLFIITLLTPMDTEWENFIETIEIVKVLFRTNFKLQLNVILLTKSEFFESSELKTRIMNKPIIEVI